MMSTCCSKHVEAWNKHTDKECVKLVINQNNQKCMTLCKNFMVFILCKYHSCCLSVGSVSNARQHVSYDSVISDSVPLGCFAVLISKYLPMFQKCCILQKHRKHQMLQHLLLCLTKQPDSQICHPPPQHTGWSKSLCAPDDYNTERYK